ncbi:hypothetical protein Desac_2939 [Desulfobacca acetoxidans DSM 11109]|uniref:Uncharacterized protein n=2 Tax=Desulfobacca acetoxidans TaxID=60893 RepID=F2NEA8_DESAR|nr:hypothetical protein Desac_2939 [Desulfobacca acetoxidans DSM 11109]
MRRQQFSFMEMFQDPIFTIIGIILLATTPMIIPGEPRFIDPRLPILLNEIDFLNQDLKAEQDANHQLTEDLGKQQDRFQQTEIQAKQWEDRAQDLHQQTRLLRENRDRLQKEVAAKTRKVTALEQEMQRLGNRGQTKGSFHVVTESSRDDFYFQVINKKLYPVNKDFYNSKDMFATVTGGNIVPVTVKTRKPKIAGVTLEDLPKPEGAFLKTLKSLNKSNDRAIFLVHKNSFALFRQARDLAFQQGYEVGWWPSMRDEIVIGSISRDERIGGTPAPGN